MPKHADYAPYRPALTKDNQDLIEHYSQGGIPEEGEKDEDGILREGDYLIHPNGERQPIGPVIAQMQIALETAEDQLSAMGTYPEDLDATKGLENIDPHGCYCRHDLSFAQRMAMIQQAAGLAGPQVQKAMEKANEAFQSGHNASTAGNLYSQFKIQCEDHRQFTRAAKLCHSETGYNLLMEKARQREGGAVETMDETLKGLEYMVGLRNEAPTTKQTTYMKECFGLSPEQMEQLRKLGQNRQPYGAQNTVPFSNFDNKLTHKFLSHPANWGKTPAQAPADYRKQELAEKDVQSYTTASVKGILQTIYATTDSRNPDSKSPASVNRGKLITVDGKPLSQVMRERYAEMKPVMDYNKWYEKNLEPMSNEIVAAALMAGKRVEAFVTDANGKVAQQPYTIAKKGFEPSPLKPVTMNAFQSFMSKHGFYKEKVAQKEEYDRVMIGRSQVLATNVVDRRNELQKHLNEGVAKGYDARCAQEGEKIDLYGHLDFGRTAAASMCTGYLLAMGYSTEDVLDPSKLKVEREKIGERITDLSQALQANIPRKKEEKETKEAYDTYLADFNADTPANAMRKRAALAAEEQVGELMYMGQKAIVEAFDKSAEYMDFRNLGKDPDFPALEVLGHAAFDISQEMKHFPKAYEAAAVKSFQADSDMQEKLADNPAFQGYEPGAPLTPEQKAVCIKEIDYRANNVSTIIDFTLRGQMTLSGDNPNANVINQAIDSILAQRIGEHLHEQQQEHLDTPVSELLDHLTTMGAHGALSNTLVPMTMISQQEKDTIRNDLRNGTMQNAFHDLSLKTTADRHTFDQCAEMRDNYIKERLPEAHQKQQQEQQKAAESQAKRASKQAAKPRR